MDDHRGERQSLSTPLGASLRHLVEAAEQPLEVFGYELAVLARQVIHAFVHRAERARAALLVEVAAETLRPALGTIADEVREFLLFVLESCRHRESPRALTRLPFADVVRLAAIVTHRY